MGTFNFLPATFMASVLNDFLSVLTPVPVSTPEQYDGWQYKWKFIVFRPARNFILFVPLQLRTNLSLVLKFEGLLLGALLFYCLFAYWGSSTNSKKAKKWHVLERNLNGAYR